MQTRAAEQSPLRSSRRAFSLPRVGVIAANTLTELTRLKAFYFILLFALLVIGTSATLARFTFQQELQVLKDISLGAMSIFTSLLAIVATGRLLSQDVDDRVAYTILAKPVRRFEYLAGKLGGVLLLLAISVVAMTLLFCLVLFLREQSALAETTRQMQALPTGQMAEALRGIRDSTFNSSLLPAVGILYLKSCLLAALTLFISTFSSSNIFSVVVAFFVYFIGHLQGSAREFWLREEGGHWLSRIFLAAVALFFPDLQQFNLADEMVAGAAIPAAMFIKAALLGIFYIVLYLLLATAVFEGKEL